MSINVTVNGSPIFLRRSRMVLSDLEQIKKNERDRRRRLRIEQVRQQTKEMSCKVLQRSKYAANKEFNKLNRDGRSQLKKMHDRKIMEIQQKYQEDMEDIGLAHKSAALQPNVDAIIEADKEKNRAAASERGKEAMQRLKESAQLEDPLILQQERLRQVREVENVRSAMISKLPGKFQSENDIEDEQNSSQEDEIVIEKDIERASPKRRKCKKVIIKKSPGKIISKLNVKVTTQQRKSKSPRGIAVDANRGSSKSRKESVAQTRRDCSVGTDGLDRKRTVCRNTDISTEVICPGKRSERDTDDQEPRKTVPTIQLTSTKTDKVTRYNPADYKQKSSESNASSSSSTVSDDSSYFSDGCSEFILPKTTPKHQASLPCSSNKVQMYDVKTRQRNAYNRPIGLVERIDIRNEPNAEEAAREVVQSEIMASNLLENQRVAAQTRRGTDATLRERVRRDYENMIKNLDYLTNEENKLRMRHDRCCNNEMRVNETRRPEVTIDCRRKVEPADEGISRERRAIVSTCTQRSKEKTTRATGPRVEHERATDYPDSMRQNEVPPVDRPKNVNVIPQDNNNGEEMSREEYILEMLKNVERQKRLLLREFGADLPNTILSASMTPLFDQSKCVATERPVIPSAQQVVPSSEIKVINMSSSDDSAKRTKTVVVEKKKRKKKTTVAPSPSKTIEMAVQTSRMDEIGAAIDKSVQVEMISKDANEVVSPKNESVASQTLEYVEPKVTVIAPEAGDSSSSSDSRVTGVVIELDNKHVKVTPKKRRIGSGKSSTRGSSRSGATAKPRSLPGSIVGSPVKRSATSAPSSRSGSPKKTDVATSSARSRSRSPDKTVDIRINRGTVKVQTGPSRLTRVSVDSSTETWMAHSTPEVQDVPAGHPYRIFKQPVVKRLRENVTARREPRDNSDTSTSYASLPAPTSSGALQSDRHRITPILEMLDSSSNETTKISRRNVSPVSTPETPSPRVINVPSNIPHPDRINRILKYSSITNGERRAEDSTLPSSTQNEQSTSTDPSYSRESEQISATAAAAVYHQPPATVHRSGKTSERCSCANPTCELMHRNMNVISEYATRSNPEVLKKYDELQNICTERIASLTALIKWIRNEEHGLEFSMTSPADETSLMQMPPPRPIRSDLQNVQKLVESIEAIHNQLAKTLLESQKIITSSAAPQLQQIQGNGDPTTCSSSYETKSKGSMSTSTEETPVPTAIAKAKPRIISDEAVHIDLEKFKRGKVPYTAMIMAAETACRQPPSSTPPHGDEDMLEKLYWEILEQSKSVDCSRENELPIEDNENQALSEQRTPSPPQQLSSRNKASAGEAVDDQVTRDGRQDSEPNKDEAFVPLLAGIPKIPRTLSSSQPGSRPRPPIAGGAYRSEMYSPRHELSTIVEFDTPDTANRSQGSARSPSGKSRRNLQLPSPSKPTTTSETSNEKNAKTQTVPIAAKSSVSDAPFLTQNMARSIPRRIPTRDAVSPDDKFVCQSPVDRALSDRGTTKSLLSQGEACCTSLEARSSRKDNNGTRSGDWLTKENAERDVSQKGNRDAKPENSGSFETQHFAATLASVNLNLDIIGNDNKNDKLTSTSSNSFSALSGISEIVSTPTSELVKWASSSEEIETALRKMGLGWAVVTLKKTREASALSSSSNSDVTPMNTARRTKSPSKKQSNESSNNNVCGGLPDFSDVSSISIKEASKSTERAVLMKARTSTPNIQNSNSTSGKSNSTTTSSSGISLQDHSDSLTAPNVSLTNNR